jgi:hypothetical protein
VVACVGVALKEPEVSAHEGRSEKVVATLQIHLKLKLTKLKLMLDILMSKFDVRDCAL